MTLELSDRKVENVTVVQLVGKMNTSTSSDADAYLSSLISNGSDRLLLNMEGVDYISSSGLRVILATGRYIGEGFDDPRLATLFLTLPISWKGTLMQYTGRLHRLHPGKTEVRTYDYVDSNVAMLQRMYERR